MTVVESGGTGGGGGGLVARVRGLLTAPTAEWRKIEAEPATVQGLFTGHLAPLAALACAASVIGMSVFGGGMPGVVTMRIPLVNALMLGLVSLVLVLGMTWVMGFVINMLAPNSGGVQNPIQAMKVAVYSATAVVLAGVLQIFPPLGVLGIVGLFFSIYLLHAGLPILMKAPPEKATGYTLSVIGVMFVLWIVAAFAAQVVTAPIMLNSMVGPMSAGVASPGGTVKIGGTTIDMGAMEKAAKEMEARSKAIEQGVDPATVAGAGKPIDLEQLKALLPAALPGGLARTEVSTGAGGAAGVGAGGASAIYENGDKRVEITIGDLGAMGAFAGMAGAMGVQGSRESADGYERTATVNGRVVTESVSRGSATAKYGVVGARFMITADGHNVGIDEVKAAVDAVGIGRVEALAK
jgi:hypothetical protein